RTEEFARWNPPSNQTTKQAPIAPTLEILDPRSHDQSVYPSNDQGLPASKFSSTSTCFNCKKTGHWSSNCPEKSIANRDKQNIQGQNVLFRGKLYQQPSFVAKSINHSRFGNNPQTSKHRVHLVDTASKEMDIPTDNSSLDENEMEFEQLIRSFDDDNSPIHDE
ncbi:hypothetical protein K3495_g17262, partial [Podosphaera aphanis]